MECCSTAAVASVGIVVTHNSCLHTCLPVCPPACLPAYGADGQPFDAGCRQRAFFSGQLTLNSLPPGVPRTFHATSARSGGTEYAAEDTRKVYVPLSVDYDPLSSRHKVSRHQIGSGLIWSDLMGWNSKSGMWPSQTAAWSNDV